MARILRGMSVHREAVGYVLLPTSSTGTGRHYAHTQRSRLGQMGWKGCDLESFALDMGERCRLLPCIQWYDSTHVCRTSYYVHFVFGGEAPSCNEHMPHHAAHGRKKPPVPLVIRPGFIEDKFGQEQIRFWSSDCDRREQAGEGGLGGRDMLELFVQTWKTWLLDDAQVRCVVVASGARASRLCVFGLEVLSSERGMLSRRMGP